MYKTNKFVSKDFQNVEFSKYNKNIRRYSAASLQFHIVSHKSNRYAKFQFCNSYFGCFPCLVLKSSTSVSPFKNCLLLNIIIKIIIKTNKKRTYKTSRHQNLYVFFDIFYFCKALEFYFLVNSNHQG